MSYAAGTRVTEERTKSEIERMLARYGCNQFQSGWDTETQFAHIGFRHGTTMVMLGVKMPLPEEFRTFTTAHGYERTRTAEQVETFYWNERRRRWRALLLVVKAKLEAVESGISTLEREFLADVVLPTGGTLGDALVPRIEALQSGRLQLPAHEER